MVDTVDAAERPRSASDPFLREIVSSALSSLTEESGFFSTRTAATAGGVSGTRDMLSCAVFDTAGRLIGQSRGVAIHQAAVYRLLQEALEEHPVESWRPGDVLLTNDVFRGGIHPTDVAVFAPIFHGGRLRFFYGGMRLVSDLGGLSSSGLPANATEVFHEGVLFPAVKLIREGELNTDVAKILQANSRTGQRVMAEILAMAGGVNLASSRLIELVQKYGYETLHSVIDDILDYSEEVIRQGITLIPDGRYSGSYVVEEDGIELGKSHLVHVEVTIDGSNCTMDFSGSGPPARGAINCTYSQALSQCVSALRDFIGADVPWNEGVYRPLKVVLPRGSLVNAEFPSATNIRMAVGCAMTDAIFMALSHARPERAVASSSTPFIVCFSGRDLLREQNFTFVASCGGSTGATTYCDGEGSAGGFGGVWTTGVEATEANYPIRCLSADVVPDSGGAGRWRGGWSNVKEYEFLAEGDLTVRANDRYLVAPLGAAGGSAGSPGAFILNRGTPEETKLRGKQTNVRVQAGGRLTAVMSGAGGYADAASRPPELVARDVRDGVVSIRGALLNYAVVIDDASLEVSVAKTEELRDRQR